MYETNVCKILMPESKSPVLLDYLNLPCLIGLLKPPLASGMFIKVTNFLRLEVLEAYQH